jgi:primary-amine oxidase
MAVTGTTAEATHPLSPLTAPEIEAAVALLRREVAFKERVLFAYAGLVEPDKAEVDAYRPGNSFERRVRLVTVESPRAEVRESVVSLSADEVVSSVVRPDTRPSLLMTESIEAIVALQADPRWQEAMRRRGITDFDKVQIDPWPSGHFGLDHEEDRRICRCLCYLRDEPEDNGYARPIEGVIGFVDLGRGEVLEVQDTGVIPVPEERGNYYEKDVGPLRSGLKALEIVQPDGPSFSIDAEQRLTWQRWSMRVSMDPIEGLVLRQVGYEDGGETRSVLYRAAVCEMVVPYGEPGPMHSWKSAFDVGEWGLGRMATSLALGCDCLGEVRYLDYVFCDEQGRPQRTPQAICIHEEDYGILWKHVDMHSGTSEVRRSRRLVVSSIATVGNYEYGFFWYFYLDGTIQFEVKLTGIMSTMAVDGDDAPFATMVAPGLAAPYHQHMFNMRLDMEVDGRHNSIEEVNAVAVPRGEDNPWGNAFTTTVTPLASEAQAVRRIDPSSSRYWRVVNRSRKNRLGQPVAYKLVPGPTPTLLADPDSSVGRRASFATANLWATRFSPEERRASGDYPNQHRGGEGVASFVGQDRRLEDQDIVLWYTFGVTHVPRPEDWPVMPVEYTGFHLVPAGFFGANPALDVPPSVGHCHDDPA